MVGKTSEIVCQKMSNLGISIPHKVHYNGHTETWVSEKKSTIFLNPEDRKSKMLAQQTMQHLLAHEIGHIFVKKFITKKTKKDPEFTKLFGDLTKHYRRKLTRIATSCDFISNYAQVHPEDNFCEVFAVYCTHEGKIRKVYKRIKKAKKSKKVRKQVYWIHKFVRELRQ